MEEIGTRLHRDNERRRPLQLLVLRRQVHPVHTQDLHHQQVLLATPHQRHTDPPTTLPHAVPDTKSLAVCHELTILRLRDGQV